MMAAAAHLPAALIARADEQCPDGPLTRARLRRAAGVYAAMVLLGAALALSAAPFWQAFGLGLMLPGGGFIAAFTSAGSALGFAAALLLTWVLFAAGFVAWFGSGNVLAPIAVWLGAALLAGLAAPAAPWQGAVWICLGLLAVGVVLLRRMQAQDFAQQQVNRDRRNAVLSAQITAPGSRHEVQELSTETLGLLRHVLDRALQPVDEYQGINWADQFQFGSLRYALCGMGYALAGVQFGATPAFRGYLSEAQRRLHAKMLDHRVWKYWVLENAWGNLRLDANPIHHRDNIMYHGWYMAMVAEYLSNTGDAHAAIAPMVLRHPSGREWRYSFSEVCEVLYNSHRKSPFTLFPCEPNWIYPMCNNFSAVALKIHDRLHGTSWWAEIEDRYRRNFNDEFCTVDGRVLAIRSAHTGITLPMFTSAMADCVTAHFQHGTLPDIARRSWEIARMDFIKVANGAVQIETKGWDNMDTGSYKPSMITTYTQVGAAAAEMGDEEVAQLLRQRVQQEFVWRNEDGVATLEKVSSQAHAVALYHFAAHANLRRNLHAQGVPVAEQKGPLLAEAPYPDALVRYARNDGAALDLVLQAGRAAAEGREVRLGFSELRPGGDYRCVGNAEQVFKADAQGQAALTVRLAGRTPLRIVPVQ